MEGFTVLDIIISVIFLYFIIHGYNKGFVEQTSTILGLLVALVIAIKQYQTFQVYLKPYIDVSPPLLNFISFAIIFILLNIVVHILGVVVKNIIGLLFLKPIDHLAGSILGLVKGGLLVYVLLLVLSGIPYDKLTNSLHSSYLASNILKMSPVINQNLKDIFDHS